MPKSDQTTAAKKKSWADRDLANYGEMLADFCAFKMIIGGSVFPHRRIRKAT